LAEGLTNREVAEVYERYGHLILRRCRGILRDSALAEDAMQEVFVKVMRYGKELQNADAPLRWLYRVADRCSFDALKKRKSRREDLEDVPLDAPHPGISAEELNIVTRFLEKLDDKARQIAVLAYFDGLSQGEIADETGWSRQTINKKMKAIHELARKYGG
jgi:RNA polymerase sigma-70 factor, ECF subfamily